MGNLCGLPKEAPPAHKYHDSASLAKETPVKKSPVQEIIIRQRTEDLFRFD